MGYYVRVLSTSADCVPLLALQSALEAEELRATLKVEEGIPDDWNQIVLSHTDGQEIACIERNGVGDGSLGADELSEFADEVVDCKPASAAKWLIDYFPQVRCVYALQVLRGTDHKNGWDIFGAVKNGIWAFAPAIFQADLEGFSNEDGYHILWQFSDSVKGDWWMSVLRDGEWQDFQMDLGNREHREAFFEGRVPDGVELG